MYTNADCLINKMVDLKIFLDSLLHKPDVIAITEVKYKNSRHFSNPELFLNGYVMYSNDFELNSRGVLIYVNEHFESSEISISSNFAENILINIKPDLCIGNIYRSPNSSKDNDTELCNFIDLVCTNLRGNLILLGDYNFRDIDWHKNTSNNNSTSSLKFLNVLQKHFLIQNVREPTRGRGLDEPHILDLVITNNDITDTIQHFSPLGRSDHSVLMINVNVNPSYVDSTPRLNFHKGKYDELRQFLDVDWAEILHVTDDVNQMWNIFKFKLLEGVEKYIPKSIPFSTWKKEKWRLPLDLETRKLIQRKHAMWKEYIKTKDPRLFTMFKKIRNKVRNKTRATDKFIQNEVALSIKNNPKHFWKFVKSKTKSNDPIGELKMTDNSGSEKIITADCDKAQILGTFFASVFNKDDDTEFKKLEHKKCLETIEPPVFEVEDIISRLKRLKTNKSPGPDTIHPKILYETANEIAYPLKIIFECSFKGKQVPKDWNYANITPIYKKGSRSDVNNYRPVSLTSVVCKVMEAIIRDHIMSHFVSNKLFSNRQFGFIKGRSVTLQLLQILDQWTESLEEGGQVDVIYTDLEKAFDKIPHKKLLSKLESYHVNKDVIDWISAFLSNRRLRVRINSEFSQWLPVTSGVPQGSLLGPILFIIYINDLVDFCDSGSDLYLYADDAKIFSYVKNEYDSDVLQLDLNKLTEWMNIWSLSLNVNKCKVISYGRKTTVKKTYAISDTNLDKVDNIKDLGVMFDCRLKFADHIQMKINKAYQMLGIIKRNFIYLTPKSFTILYKATVRSHLEYSVNIWSPYHQYLIEKLEKVQKRATKLVLSVKKLKYEDRLRQLNLTTLKYRRLRGDMIETFKIFNGIYDTNVTNWFTNRSVASSYNIRGHQYSMFQYYVHYDTRKYFFTNRIIPLWNSLPSEVVLSDTIDTFKNRLDKFWMNQEFKYNWRADIIGTGSRTHKFNVL